jgi:NAD(P)-dependent dehydrogenase (short-subunit alcohol dehydrogenase family)
MSGSVAIVTGASSGIGRAAAIRLARDFSGIVLAARGAAELKKVSQEVKASGAVALPIDLDPHGLRRRGNGRGPDTGGFCPDRCASEYRRRRTGSRSVRNVRRTIESGHGA